MRIVNTGKLKLTFILDIQEGKKLSNCINNTAIIYITDFKVVNVFAFMCDS